MSVDRPARVLYDNKGRIVSLSSDVLGDTDKTRDALGATRVGARRLNYSERLTTADPGTRLASAITDGGSGVGISFPLTGGWGSADWAGAYPYIVWSVTDLFGAPLGGTFRLTLPLTLILRPTVPGATEEYLAVLAVVNETDLTTATIDGYGIALDCTGVTGPRLVSARTSNGTSAQNSGSPNATAIAAVGVVEPRGVSGTTHFHPSVTSLDSSGVALQSLVNVTNLTTFGVPSRLYLALAIGRTNAGAGGALTINVDAYVNPVLRSGHVLP